MKGDHVMKIGNIAGNRQSQQGIASCSIADLSGDTTDNLSSIHNFRGVDDGGSAQGIRIHLICRGVNEVVCGQVIFR